MGEKTCFVVMGFGEKTDYQIQRTLNLDKTYRGIIKLAVEDCGLKCIRADDIVHAGIIVEDQFKFPFDRLVGLQSAGGQIEERATDDQDQAFSDLLEIAQKARVLFKSAPEDWMQSTTQKQLHQLRKLL